MSLQRVRDSSDVGVKPTSTLFTGSRFLQQLANFLQVMQLLGHKRRRGETAVIEKDRLKLHTADNPKLCPIMPICTGLSTAGSHNVTMARRQCRGATRNVAKPWLLSNLCEGAGNRQVAVG